MPTAHLLFAAWREARPYPAVYIAVSDADGDPPPFHPCATEDCDRVHVNSVHHRGVLGRTAPDVNTPRAGNDALRVFGLQRTPWRAGRFRFRSRRRRAREFWPLQRDRRRRIEPVREIRQRSRALVVI